MRFQGQVNLLLPFDINERSEIQWDVAATSSFPWQQKWSLWMNVWKEWSGNTGCKCRTRVNVILKWSARMIHYWKVAIIQSATQKSNVVIKLKTEQFPHVNHVCSFLRCFEILSTTTNRKHIKINIEFKTLHRITKNQITSVWLLHVLSILESRYREASTEIPRMKSCWRHEKIRPWKACGNLTEHQCHTGWVMKSDPVRHAFVLTSRGIMESKFTFRQVGSEYMNVIRLFYSSKKVRRDCVCLLPSPVSNRYRALSISLPLDKHFRMGTCFRFSSANV